MSADVGIWTLVSLTARQQASRIDASHAGVQAVTGAAGASTTALQQALAGTAGSAQSAGGQYQTTEHANGEGLKAGDFTGVMGDVIGAGTGLFGTLPQSFGALTGLVGSGAGVIGSLMGAAVSGQHMSQDKHGEAEPHSGDEPTWNPNNNNPQASHDYANTGPYASMPPQKNLLRAADSSERVRAI